MSPHLLYDEKRIHEMCNTYVRYLKYREQLSPTFSDKRFTFNLKETKLKYVLKDIVVDSVIETLVKECIERYQDFSEVYHAITRITSFFINDISRQAFVKACQLRMHKELGRQGSTHMLYILEKAVSNDSIEHTLEQCVKDYQEELNRSNKYGYSNLIPVTTVAIVETNHRTLDIQSMYCQFKAPSPEELFDFDEDVYEDKAMRRYFISVDSNDPRRLLSIYEIENTRLMKWLASKEQSGPNVPLFKKEMIGQIVGMKADGFPTLGFFRKLQTRSDWNSMIQQEQTFVSSGHAIEGDRLSDGAHFKNCITINIICDQRRIANIKVFNGGRLQVTGIPRESDGLSVVKFLELWLSSNNMIETNDPNDTITSRVPFIRSYTSSMINTTFDLGFSIHRDRVKLILENTFNLRCSCDTEGYQGLHIYYYIPRIPGPEEGVCTCNTLCLRTNRRSQQNQRSPGDHVSKRRRVEEVPPPSCRVVTIALFQSGRAIVATGNGTMSDIEAAYNFIGNTLYFMRPLISKDTLS
jgi:hypothetical protein